MTRPQVLSLSWTARHPEPSAWLAAGTGLVVLLGSIWWLALFFGNLDPCGAAGELSSVCAAPPAAVRAGQLAIAVPSAIAGVVAGALAVLAARRRRRVRWQLPALTVFGVLLLAWVVAFDLGILSVGG